MVSAGWGVRVRNVRGGGGYVEVFMWVGGCMKQWPVLWCICVCFSRKKISRFV